MAGTIKTNVQLGDSNTATQNFTLTAAAADGTMKLARGNAGATTQDLITVDSTGNVQLTKTTNQSMVRLNTANGYGSTNTVIRRFTTTVTNQGSDITYADSATLGASFTVNTAGVYAISYTDQFNASSAVGISLNTTQPTTSIQSLTNASEIVATARSVATGNAASCGATLYLAAGSVIRPHNIGDASGANTTNCVFTITRVS